MNEPSKKTIDEIIADGILMDLALKKAGQKALLEHKQAGNSIAVWRSGKVVWIPPEEIPVDSGLSELLC